MGDYADALSEYEYLWTTEKELWDLNRLMREGTVMGYVIHNEAQEEALLITDPDFKDQLVEKLIAEGIKIVDVQI